MKTRRVRLATRAHPFVPAAADRSSCAVCRLPEKNQVHDPDHIKAEAERRAAYARRLAEYEES